MRTPALWQQESALSRLATPFGWLYYNISRLHRGWQKKQSKAEKLSAPIICVGNVIAGGAGKTPTVRMLSAMLKIAGQEPHCISRGYGGQPQTKPLRVDPLKHKASQVGDEALLLAQTCPSWISTDRQTAAKEAIVEGATIVLADDGLQNPSFYKDVSLLIMDSHYGIGNGKLIPAGPLREPLAEAMKRCHAIILIGDGPYRPPTTLPIWQAQLDIVTDLNELKAKPTIAFAGIARPQKFFDSLREQNIEPLETITYPDHHPYSPTDIALLLQKAEEHQATLLTTAKDYVKLPESFRDHCMVVDVKLRLEKSKEFLNWLEEQIAHG